MLVTIINTPLLSSFPAHFAYSIIIVISLYDAAIVHSKLGKQYITWVESPKTGVFRMFDSDFLEFFAKTKWQV